MYEKYRCFRRQIANPWPVSQAGRLYAGADLFAQRRPGLNKQLQLRVIGPLRVALRDLNFYNRYLPVGGTVKHNF